LTGYAQIPDRVVEYLIVTETGWTLEYIRNLPEGDYEAVKLMSRIYANRAPRNQVMRMK